MIMCIYIYMVCMYGIYIYIWCIYIYTYGVYIYIYTDNDTYETRSCSILHALFFVMCDAF